MIRQLLFDNPVLTKHVRSRLRRPQSAYLIVMVLAICGCLMWAGQAGIGFQNGTVFVLFFVMQGAVLHLLGTSQVASSIGQVNDSGILDFHRITPLPPLVTAAGFVLGAPVREYLVALIALPFMLGLAVTGKPGIFGFATAGVVLTTTTWLFHVLAMTSGLMAPRGKTRGATMGLAFLLVIATLNSSTVFLGLPIPGLLTAGPALIEAMDWNVGAPQQGGLRTPTFFGQDLPIFLQSLIYQIPLIVFLSIPVVRRMRSAQASLFSKQTAIAFLAVISVLNIGGVLKHQLLQADVVILVLLYINLAAAAFLTFTVTPDRGMFLNHLRRSHKLRMLSPPLWSDDASNRAAVLVFAGISYAMVQSVLSFDPAAPKGFDFVLPTVSALATIVYFGLATQFFRIKLGRQGNTTLFVFLFFVWFLPLVAGGLCMLTFKREIGEMVMAVSPLIGIGAKSSISVGVSCGMALLFLVALLREEGRLWDKVKSDANVWVDDEER